MLSSIRAIHQAILHAPSNFTHLMNETTDHLFHSKEFRVSCALGTVTILVSGLCDYVLGHPTHRGDSAKRMALETIRALAYGLLAKSSPEIAIHLMLTRISPLNHENCDPETFYRLSWLTVVFLGALTPHGMLSREFVLKSLCHIKTFKMNYLCGAIAILASGLYGYATTKNEIRKSITTQKQWAALSGMIETTQLIAYTLLLTKTPIGAAELLFETFIRYENNLSRHLIWRIAVIGGTFKLAGIKIAELDYYPEARAYPKREQICTIIGYTHAIFRLYVDSYSILKSPRRTGFFPFLDTLTDRIMYHLNVTVDLAARGMLLVKHPLMGLAHLFNHSIVDEKKSGLEKLQKGKIKTLLLTGTAYFLSSAIFIGAALLTAHEKLHNKHST